MALERHHPIFMAPPNGPNPELMLSAVLHLMSHYTAQHSTEGGCVKLASVIERHLKALSSLPELAPVLRATCAQLSEQWAQVVERQLPLPERSGFLARIMTRARHATSMA